MELETILQVIQIVLLVTIIVLVYPRKVKQVEQVEQVEPEKVQKLGQIIEQLPTEIVAEPSPSPTLVTGIEYPSLTEILYLRDKEGNIEWVHHGWAIDNSLAYHHAINTPGLAIRKDRDSEIIEGVQ